MTVTHPFRRPRMMAGCIVAGTLAGMSPAVAVADQAAEIKEIRSVWKGYREAVTAKNGQKAVSYLARPTLQFYGNVAELALKGNQATLAKLPTLNRMLVYLVRIRYSGRQLTGMSARQFLVHWIDNGYTQSGNPARGKLGKIVIAPSGSHASAFPPGIDDQGAQMRMFQKEGGRWKLDMTHLIRFAAKQMEARFKKMNLPEEVLLRLLLKRANRDQNDFRRLQQPLLKP